MKQRGELSGHMAVHRSLGGLSQCETIRGTISISAAVRPYECSSLMLNKSVVEFTLT
jgi:hypothetical protein